MTLPLTPSQTRANDPRFRQAFSLEAIRTKLPLRPPTNPHVPPSPKSTYRSHYLYQGLGELKDLSQLEHLSNFDLVLRLVDFSPLRDTLAYLLGWSSGKGHPPFDPVSIFLLHGWQITNGWNRAQTLKNLKDPRYADYASLFGFQADFPSEGGLRHFLTSLGRPLPDRDHLIEMPVVEKGRTPEKIAVHRLNYLLSQIVAMLREARMIGDQAWSEALVCPDGMIHQAASHMKCPFVTDSCYRKPAPSTDSPKPTKSTPRTCPARERGFKGVDDAILQNVAICPKATPRDPTARSVLYQRNNRQRNSESDAKQKQHKQARLFYGYRSLPLQLADPTWRCHFPLLDHFQPANLREEVPAAALLRALSYFYPTLHVDTVAGDAGFGYDIFLSTVYDIKARRVVDTRTHETDKDHDSWIMRGYDDKGRPVCEFGYPLTANGYDSERQRKKWFCQKVCTRENAKPLVKVAEVEYPPKECPYRNKPYGKMVNVGKRFPDGSIRLVRDVLPASPEWKKLYRRGRNAVEARNAEMERWHLKRLHVYGEERGRAMIALADTWNIFSTLARSVREATAATGA